MWGYTVPAFAQRSSVYHTYLRGNAVSFIAHYIIISHLVKQHYNITIVAYFPKLKYCTHTGSVAHLLRMLLLLLLIDHPAYYLLLLYPPLRISLGIWSPTELDTFLPLPSKVGLLPCHRPEIYLPRAHNPCALSVSAPLIWLHAKRLWIMNFVILMNIN